MPLLTERGGDTLLAVRLQPRAARTEVAGLHAGALKVRVAAPPAGGAANAALCALLAARLDIPASRVTVERGKAARTKVVCVHGLGPAQVAARLGLPGPRPG
jgi:hypothetical protein